MKKYLSILFVLIASFYLAIYSYIPHQHGDKSAINMEITDSSGTGDHTSDPNPFHKDFCSVDHHTQEARTITLNKFIGNTLPFSAWCALPVLWENLLILLTPSEPAPFPPGQTCMLYASVIGHIRALRAPPCL